jgi:hypothetical protein
MVEISARDLPEPAVSAKGQAVERGAEHQRIHWYVERRSVYIYSQLKVLFVVGGGGDDRGPVPALHGCGD